MGRFPTRSWERGGRLADWPEVGGGQDPRPWEHKGPDRVSLCGDRQGPKASQDERKEGSRFCQFPDKVLREQFGQRERDRRDAGQTGPQAAPCQTRLQTRAGMCGPSDPMGAGKGASANVSKGWCGRLL